MRRSVRSRGWHGPWLGAGGEATEGQLAQQGQRRLCAEQRKVRLHGKSACRVVRSGAN